MEVVGTELFVYSPALLLASSIAADTEPAAGSGVVIACAAAVVVIIACIAASVVILKHFLDK